MKTFILAALISSCCAAKVCAQSVEINSPAANRAPRVSSPEVLPDRRVTFRLAAPKASEVQVSGEFMRGSTNLEKNDDGVWSVTVGPLAPEIYHYNFTIDGVRTIDPGNPEVKTGSTAGTIGSILEVKGATPAFYDVQPVPHGEIHTHWYPSKSLNTTRRLTVYTPPGYDPGRRARYPVLYLLHGANADEDAWHRLGHVNLILDNLLAAKKTKPFIIVMPFGYGVPPGNSSAQGQNTALFGQDLLADVIPFIESHYRTYADRDHRALVGLSMGGGETMSIGLNHLESFSYLGGFSSGLGNATNFSKSFAAAIATPKSTNQKLRLLWIGCGKEDGAFATNKKFSDFLDEHGIRHVFHESDGAHTWMVWRRYLNEIAPRLFE
jgi:enterochelin esterase-like enzyme